MSPELAAFRLHALSSLVSHANNASRQAVPSADFHATLLAARGLGAADLLSQTQPVPASQSLFGQQTHDLLTRLEASNRTFLQHYNARVSDIGQESEVLDSMRTRMMELGTASRELERLDPKADSQQIRDALQAFIKRYNDWDAEFDPYFERGALLDNNQAGDLARFSLRREVGTIFHGAGNGGFEKGLTDMGVSITPDGQLKLDEAAFESAYVRAGNQVVQTLHNMARAFGDSAELLTSDGHLLERRIDNAERAIAWAADKQAEVEAEFGPGAVASRLIGKV